MRERALKRLARLLRLAEDKRTPQGEREAAEERIRVLHERYGFTHDEVMAECRAMLDAERPRRRPMPRPQAAPHFPMGQGWGQPIGVTRIFVSFGGGFAAEGAHVEL